LFLLAVSPLTALLAGGTPNSTGPSTRLSAFPQYFHAAMAFLLASTWQPLSFLMMLGKRAFVLRLTHHWKWGVPSSPFSSYALAAIAWGSAFSTLKNSSSVMVGLFIVPVKFLDICSLFLRFCNNDYKTKERFAYIWSD
jgi:hypothetical protein